MPSHVDDNKPNTLGQDGGMLQSRLVYRRDVGSRKFQSLKLIRSKLTVPRCAFTPTRSAHSAQEPSVYRRKRWDIREKDRLSARWSEVKMAEGKQGANIGGNIGAGAGILAKRFQKSMNRAQEKVGGVFWVQDLGSHVMLLWVCILCVGIQHICSKMFRGLRKTGTNVHKICK